MTAEDVRAQIVEAMAEAIRKHYFSNADTFPRWVPMAAAALDAALAARVQELCPYCKGVGHPRLPNGRLAYSKCETCEGRGTVPSDVPAIVELLMERETEHVIKFTVDGAMVLDDSPTYNLRSIPPGDAK